VLFVGRLTYYKGLETLVAAAAGTPEAEVLVAGDGEERGRIERTIQRASVGDRVRLLGEVDDDTLAALLASCHVFALPSKERTEAFGVSLLEAMRYGKPLIVSRLAGSGVLEVAQDGENAILVPPDDIDAWRRALALAATSPNRLRALGERGAARFLREYDVRVVAASIRRILALSHVAAYSDADNPTQLPIDVVAESRRARAGQYLIVIPALNEAATIGEVVRTARSQSGAHRRRGRRRPRRRHARDRDACGSRRAASPPVAGGLGSHADRHPLRHTPRLCGRSHARRGRPARAPVPAAPHRRVG
jgi:hypothetical protein